MNLNFGFFLAFLLKFTFSFNDFPTLMTANATMAVIIEKTFYQRKVLSKETSMITRDTYENSVASFTSVLKKTARQRMNNSALIIHVLHDTAASLAKDYTILLSVATCSVTWDLFERAKKEKLVHLALTDFNCPRLPADEGLSIPLIDPGDELAQIFYDLRITEGLKWQRATIIHDAVFSNEIGKVIEAFSNELPLDSTIGLASNSLFSIKRGKSETITKRRIQYTLMNLPYRRPADDRFLIFLRHETIPIFIETARSLRMLHTGSQWLFVIPDMVKFTNGNITYLIEYLDEGENIAFLYNNTQIIKSDDSCRVGAICHVREIIGALGLALEKALSKEIELFERVTEEEFESIGNTKLVRSRDIISDIKDELYNDTKTRGARGSTCGRCIRWILASALTWGNKIGRANENKTHKLVQTGIWTPDPGFQYKDHIFPHVLYGFLGKNLPIGTYHNPPWQFEVTMNDNDLLTSPSSRTSKWDGFIFNILEELARKLNFTFTPIVIESPPEIIAAKKDPMKAVMSAAERIPEALTQLVRNKEVFLAACADTSAAHGKDNTINFTHPLTVQTYGILAPKPKPLSRALLFASPFSTEAWACLASAIVIVGPVLYAVYKFSPRQTDEELKNPDSSILVGLASPAKCIWYIYGALLQQGGMHLPKTDGARLIVGTWWLVVMVLVATYSGSLVAFLTFPRMEPAIKTVDDLLQRRAEFTWTIPIGSFLEDFLTVSSTEGVIDYSRLLRENELHADKHDTLSYDDNIEKVKNSQHAVIDWMSSLRVSIRNEHIATGICHFSLGNDVLFLDEPIAMIVPSDSPYLGIINAQLQRMQEAGLLNKWISDWMPMKDQCWESGAMSQATDNHKVNLEDMQGIFFVLIFGYFIGTFFLGWEFLKYKLQLAKEAKLIRPFRD